MWSEVKALPDNTGDRQPDLTLLMAIAGQAAHRAFVSAVDPGAHASG